MSEFKIEKDVPFPTNGSKYPLKEMEVNDSFFLPGRNSQGISGCFVPHRPKKFRVRTRTENGVDGVRIWRVA